MDAIYQKVLDLKTRFRKHPGVYSIGVTRADDGRWALRIVHRKNIAAPFADVGEEVEGIPVLYDSEPDLMPVARPAFPDRGE